MGTEPAIDEIFESLDAHFDQSHAALKAMVGRRKDVIDREFRELRELWWAFDPLELQCHRELIEDEYDSYVITCYLVLRDETDLHQIVRESLEKMAREKHFSNEQVALFCFELRKWWAGRSSD